MKNEKIKIAILASGKGSNAEKIIQHFHSADGQVEVDSIFSNRKHAGVFKIAEKYSISAFYYSTVDFKEGVKRFIKELKERNVSFIILSGFLLKVPEELCSSFKNRILNIHPSLLPKYGGKGMYGHYVHDAVKQAKEKETGITIHLVNENFDDGKIIFQKSCDISQSDTAEDIALKVQRLEHKHFPKVIEQYISNY